MTRTRRLDLDNVRDNLRYREQRGTLRGQLPAMKLICDEIEAGHIKVSETRSSQALAIFRDAMRIAGATADDARYDLDTVAMAQVRAYALCLGGFLGHSAACQPADFGLDDRTGFTRAERGRIDAAVAHLLRLAARDRLDPRNLPDLPADFHNMGVF